MDTENQRMECHSVVEHLPAMHEALGPKYMKQVNEILRN
jgi:hypothetical protein